MAYEMCASPVASGPQGQIIVMPQPVVAGYGRHLRGLLRPSEVRTGVILREQGIGKSGGPPSLTYGLCDIVTHSTAKNIHKVKTLHYKVDVLKY